MNLRRLAQLCIPIAALSWMLGGCAAVAVRPEGELPKPLVVPTPAKVGVVVTTEAGNYVHKESRASVNYEAQLGSFAQTHHRADLQARRSPTRRCSTPSTPRGSSPA